MSIALRICLYSPAAGSESAFGNSFEGLDDVQVLDHCRDWNQLQEHLRVGRADAVAVDLDDGDANARFLPIRRIAEIAPDCAIIAVSSDTNPDTIIAAMRAGCTQFVRAPIDAADLRTALDRIRQTRVPLATGCKQIGAIGSSGGAGATTLVCNLALELAHLSGRRVALVDMDLQFGDVACAFDRNSKYSVADVCRGGVNIDRTLLETALDELPCNVSILPRPNDLEEAEEVNPAGVEQMFRCLAQMFPFVVVDFPRHFSLSTLSALRALDHILIVSQLAVPFLRNATRIYQCLLQAGIQEKRVEFVLNRVAANHERIKPEEVEKHFGQPVFAAIPNDYKHVTASRDLGHPILASAPHSPARLAIQDLARRLGASQLGEGEDEVATGKRGLLRRIFTTRRTAEQPAPND